MILVFTRMVITNQPKIQRFSLNMYVTNEPTICEKLTGLPTDTISNIYQDSISVISGGCLITTLIYSCFCS